MTPNIITSATGALYEEEAKDFEDTQNTKPSEPESRKLKVVWRNVILFAYLHIAAIYGLYLALTSAKWYTLIWGYLLYSAGGLGITAGAHRLWAHRSYKAKWPLRLILVFFNTIAFQDAVVHWARDHRVHHKFSETDADPHNARRGFFFSHVGWLLCKKHPDVKIKGKCVDMSDLYEDPILRFQKNYYLWIMPICCFIMPAVVPYLWGESFHNSWFICSQFRYTFTLNCTWLVNSAAHMFGSKPYDRYINPVQNKTVSVLALGEGWHNYHHTFPWDYKTSELGQYSTNFTTLFINTFAKIGWAYDMKTVPSEMIRKRVERTGDGSHELWGWGDKDQSQEERDEALILSKEKKQ